MVNTRLADERCRKYRKDRNPIPFHIKIFVVLPRQNVILDFSASEVLGNHKSVLASFGLETSDDDLDKRCTTTQTSTDPLPVHPNASPSICIFSSHKPAYT